MKMNFKIYFIHWLICLKNSISILRSSSGEMTLDSSAVYIFLLVGILLVIVFVLLAHVKIFCFQLLTGFPLESIQSPASKYLKKVSGQTFRVFIEINSLTSSRVGGINFFLAIDFLTFLSFFSFLHSLLVFTGCSLAVRWLFTGCSICCSLFWYFLQLVIVIKRLVKKFCCSICCSILNSFKILSTLLSLMPVSLESAILLVINCPGFIM